MKNRLLLTSWIALTLLSSACHQSMKARTPQTLVQGKPQITYTTVARTPDELPRCDLGSEGLKAYLSNSDSFVKCNQFRWLSVRPGDTTGRFEARNPIRYNEWHDAKGKRRWSAPQSREIELEKAPAQVCQKGWSLPTAEELKAASLNGLFDGIKAHGGIGFDKAWTADKGALGGIARGQIEDGTPPSQALKSAGVYCVAPA